MQRRGYFKEPDNKMTAKSGAEFKMCATFFTLISTKFDINVEGAKKVLL